MKRAIARIPMPALLGGILFAITLTPLAASANQITVPFTISAPSGSPFYWITAFSSSPFQQFNPADGTLTGVEATLTGSAS
ncbi:MAG: hypothetical protein ACRD2B_15230 [Terriglobia bacterium]